MRAILKARLRVWLFHLGYARKKWLHYKIEGDREHHWLEENRRLHKHQAAETNERQILKTRPYVHKWEHKMHEAAGKVHELRKQIEKLEPPAPHGEGWSVPATRWNPYRRKIANWIIPEIEFAARHGWGGIVVSGMRTYAEQKVLWERYLHGGNIAAEPGKSNHEGYVYPRGAIDVSAYEQFAHVISEHPHRLHWGIVIHDYVHFSASGR